MLFVLFGTIGDFGVKCRNYFEEKYKFKYIEKKIYDSKNPDLRGEVDGKFYGSLTAVKKCDFWYENKKRVIGFNFNQIESAVRGKENCLLTLSAHNIKLLRQLKAKKFRVHDTHTVGFGKRDMPKLVQYRRKNKTDYKPD